MAKKEPYILAIDLGTSGCKTALISISGQVAGWEYQEIPLLIPSPGAAEQRPEDWWQALLSTSKKLIGKNLVPVEDIIAVCCSTQGEVTVPVDQQGNALMNAMGSMDMRGAESLKQLTEGRINIEGYHPLKLIRWINLTGGAPSLRGGDPSAHMLYIRDNFPEIYSKTYKFLNVLDYLNLLLTGRFVTTPDLIMTSWVTDNRDASHVVYHPGLVRGSGIEADKFPEIIACDAVVGELKPEVASILGLKAGVKVVAGSIDVTAAAIGSGAVKDFETHLYIGTSSWLAAHVPFKKTDITTNMASLPCAITGKYLLIATQTTAGGTLNYLRDNILYHKDELLMEEQVPDVFQIMDRIAGRVPAGSNGVMFAPWIYGERAPVDDRFVRAALFNLSLENSREDIIRAVMEGVAFNTRWLLAPVEKFLGRKLSVLNYVGGGAKSNIWCQILADVLNLTIRQVRDPIQANARGAAFIAAVGLGYLKYEDIPGMIEYNASYAPNSQNRDIYDKMFDVFVKFYKQNKALYKRLNG
ncbi:MAG TPA: xylulose kinase [Anaerolineae bacterium]|nr:xylulose kinase [Anaerolineae bacterium]HCC78831.1 xylulose kinase [Anaerolineae bacterium]HCM97168.1 xylulose kinase [Anaerolineae bacterium]